MDDDGGRKFRQKRAGSDNYQDYVDDRRRYGFQSNTRASSPMDDIDGDDAMDAPALPQDEEFYDPAEVIRRREVVSQMIRNPRACSVNDKRGRYADEYEDFDIDRGLPRRRSEQPPMGTWNRGEFDNHYQRMRPASHEEMEILQDDEDEADDNDDTPGGILYRSNVQSVVKEIRTLPLTDNQIEKLKLTPFWWFVYAALEMNDPKVLKQFKKKNFIITRILKRFRREGRVLGFSFGSKFVVPKREDFELTFGIRCGRRPVVPGSGSVRRTNFLERCFPRKLDGNRNGGQYRLSPTLIYNTLMEKVSQADANGAEDVARLMHLYLLASFFMPNLALSMNWRLTETVSNFSTLCDYDWSSYILDDLMEDINKNRTLKIGSCSIFVLFWLCELTDIMSPVPGCKVFPRFLKWDLHEMGKKMLNLDFDNLIRYTEVRHCLVPTEQELSLLYCGVDVRDYDEEQPDDNSQSDVVDHSVRLPMKDKGKRKIGEGGSSSAMAMYGIKRQHEMAQGGSRVNAVERAYPRDLFSDVDLPVFNFDKPVDEPENRASDLAPGPKNLFPDFEVKCNEKDQKIEELEGELLKASELIMTQKADLDVAETLKMKYASEQVLECKEQLKVEIDDLKKKLSETELVRSRLSVKTHDDKQRLARLGDECWQYKHNLERERVAHNVLKAEHEELKKVNLENENRKVQLIVDNDRLNARLLDAMKVISEAGLSFEPDCLSNDESTRVLSCGVMGEGTTMNGSEIVRNTMMLPVAKENSEKGAGNLLLTPYVSTCGSEDSHHSTTQAFASNSVGSSGHKASSSMFKTPVNANGDSADCQSVGNEQNHSVTGPKANSMILRVQARTRYDVRKRTEVGTPIPIALGDPGKKPSEGNEVRAMLVDRNSATFRSLREDVVAWLEHKFSTTEPLASVLQLENSQMSTYITLKNVESILNNEMLEDAVIDAWGLLISLKVNAEINGRVDRVLLARQAFIFHSCCWINVARNDLPGQYAARCARYIDKKIMDALSYDLWIFPINTSGDNNPRTHDGNQWSLLHFAVRSGTWLFYNPKAPENSEQDGHYLAAMTLAKYVEKRIRNCSTRRNIPVLKKDWVTTVRWYGHAVQQAPGTLDCGVVVCSMMESVLRKQCVLKKMWTAADGAEQRGNMVNTFCYHMMAKERADQP